MSVVDDVLFLMRVRATPITIADARIAIAAMRRGRAPSWESVRAALSAGHKLGVYERVTLAPASGDRRTSRFAYRPRILDADPLENARPDPDGGS